MVDVLLLCITIVMVLIVFGVSFYMLIVYCHPDDKKIGASIPSKVVVVLGMGLCWGQLLLVPLDVSNSLSGGGIDLDLLYSIVYIVIYVFGTAVVPFMIFLYESDEDDPACKRIGWCVFFTVVVQVVTSLLVFVSYIWLGVYKEVDGVKYRMDVVAYMMVCMSFAGWFLLAIFGGVGLLALPLDLINTFVKRPKPLKPEEAREKKKNIEAESSSLIELGEVLKEEETQLSKSEEGWWSKRRMTGQLNAKFENYKQAVTALEEQAEIFQAELAIDKENPVFAFLSLVLGVICLFLTVVWLLQILLGVIFRPNGVPVYGFVNELFASLNRQGLNFVSTGIYGVLTIYLLWCVQKGNLSFGLRIPFVTSFHPMKRNETYLNSFLFNINLMLFASLATTQLSVYAFYSYTAGSHIGGILSGQAESLPMFGFVFTKRVFPITMLCICTLQGIYSVVRSCCLGRRKKKE